MYHLTDLPGFVSGRYVSFLDPHCEFVSGASSASPGVRFDFVSGSSGAHADQLAPFRAFGCDVAAPYGGTLFRMPLRTAAQAATSRLSRQAHDAASVRAVLAAFRSEAVSCLLFLRSVETIELSEARGLASAFRHVTLKPSATCIVYLLSRFINQN